MLQELEIKPSDRVLIYGIGNEARQDDALGIKIIQALESTAMPSGWTLDANYQLNAEVALQMSEYDVVLFVDASKKEIPEPYYIEGITASPRVAFSTHAMSAPSLLGLCEQLYQKKPRCYWLGVIGMQWGFGEDLSDKAQLGMQKALKDLNQLALTTKSSESPHA